MRGIARAGARRGTLLWLVAIVVASLGSVDFASGDHNRDHISDFNSDGFADLAVGVPDEDLFIFSRAGAVNVIYGSASGLPTSTAQYWSKATGGVPGDPQAYELFGSSLTSGDFNGDGFDDLAIGSPQTDVGAMVDAGAVFVLYGSASGLTSAGAEMITQDTAGVEEQAELRDRFGLSLATGSFGRGPQDDLAIGIPYEDVTTTNVTPNLIGPDAGAVAVMYGAVGGLVDGNGALNRTDDFITKRSLHKSPGSSLFTRWRFGWTVASGSFGEVDQSEDILVVASPEPDNRGSIDVIPGGPDGLRPLASKALYQGLCCVYQGPCCNESVKDRPEPGDWFGYALAVGDFGNGPEDDLAVGVPGEDKGIAGIDFTTEEHGSVHVFYGSSGGLAVDDPDDEIWHQDTSGVKGERESGDGFGWSIAAANLGHDERDDLAIGIPGEFPNGSGPYLGPLVGPYGPGAVAILFGTAGGLASDSPQDQIVHQDTAGVPGAPEAGDKLGQMVFAANFGRSAFADLVVGVPGEDIGPVPLDQGLLDVFFGGSGGLTTAPQEIRQEQFGPRTLQYNNDVDDSFGSVLSEGRLSIFLF